MGQYRTILLIADPELENSAAIARGTSLARATGATLHLCVIDYNVGVAAFQRVDEPLSQSLADVFVHQRMAWLRKQCGLLEQEGIRCKFSVVWGHPVQQMILAKVTDMQPDLVLKDVHAVPAQGIHYAQDAA